MPYRFDSSAFGAAIREVVVNHLKDKTSAALYLALDAAVDIAEQRLTEGLRQEEVCAIACRAGCGTCCHVNVSILWPEAFAIANYLIHLPSEERGELVRKLEHVALRTRWMEEEERIHLGIACPFLSDEQACSIYAVRPLLCRSVTSTDPDLCRQALDTAWEDVEVLVVMNLFQKSLMEEAFRSVGDALASSGLNHRSVELVAAVRAVLRYSSLVDDYISARKFETHIFD